MRLYKECGVNVTNHHHRNDERHTINATASECAAGAEQTKERRQLHERPRRESWRDTYWREREHLPQDLRRQSQHPAEEQVIHSLPGSLGSAGCPRRGEELLDAHESVGLHSRTANAHAPDNYATLVAASEPIKSSSHILSPAGAEQRTRPARSRQLLSRRIGLQEFLNVFSTILLNEFVKILDNFKRILCEFFMIEYLCKNVYYCLSADYHKDNTKSSLSPKWLARNVDNLVERRELSSLLKTIKLSLTTLLSAITSGTTAKTKTTNSLASIFSSSSSSSSMSSSAFTSFTSFLSIHNYNLFNEIIYQNKCENYKKDNYNYNNNLNNTIKNTNNITKNNNNYINNNTNINKDIYNVECNNNTTNDINNEIINIKNNNNLWKKCDICCKEKFSVICNNQCKRALLNDAEILNVYKRRQLPSPSRSGSLLLPLQSSRPSTLTPQLLPTMAASFPRRESSARPTATARKCWAVNTLVLLLLICVPAISGSMHNMKYSNNIVKTKYGPLRGILIRSSPPIVEAYLGVPYASPPLGNLRYMPPVTPSTWKTTKLADHFSPVCPQAPPVPSSGPEALLEIPRGRLAQLRRLLPLLANQSEDCLYLNVYVPKIDDETGSSTGKKLSTIVYIHGESYEWNSGNPYDGSILAAHGNVIVVTINFRLGVLGFLKTGAKSSTQGNFGLMDLVAGLHWLRENLPAFNGNPENVTLMGHGTGAALANILIVSPVASDLIHRAVLLSGSALSPWALQKDPLYIKRRVAEHTGCHGDLAEDDLAPCLRAKPIADLLSVKLDTPRFLPGFAPFIDGTVIANPSNAATSPLTLPSGSAIASTSGIELADFPTRELLFGLTTIESYLDLSAQDLEFGFNETRRDRILRTYVRNVYHYHLNEIYSALKNEYTDWERPPRNPLGSRDAALELLSDGHTAAPLVRLGYLHSLRGGRSYFLHFRHQSGERDFTQRSGSVRGEDVPFCLGLPLTPLFPYNYTKQDLQISRILIRYLANFAQTGNPNGLISPTNADISHNNNNNINNNYGSSHLIHKASSSITNSNNNNNQNIPESMSLVKEKRRRDLINNRKLRNKRNKNNKIRDVSHLDNNNVNSNDFHDEHNGINGGHDDDGEEKEEEDDDEDMDNANAEDNEPQNPFWDSYDSINQLYLELGTKVEIRNHYRGHKLSMWLSLIPQLHSPGDSSEMSMRHHHFLEESAQYYDGIVRPQLFQKPPITKIVTPPPATPAPTTTTTTPATTTATAINRIEVTPILPLVPTECPPNTTIVPTIAATRPQQNQASINDNAGLLKRLATSHYQSYTTALTVTIAVGCFLLLLNVFIFAAIYYQREKRANDTKKKEELTEAEILHSSSSPSIDRYQQKSSRKSSLQSVSGAGFGEYSCYEEKLHCKEKRALVDLCTVELPMHDYKCSPQSGSNTGSLRRSGTPDNPYKSQNNQSHENLVIYPPCYSSQPPSVSDNSGGGSSSNLATSTSTFRNVQNQSTQSDPPTSQDVGTTINEDDEDFSPDIPDPPPPPKSLAPFGILRQQGGPTTPGSSKKRVQIQEISV